MTTSELMKAMADAGAPFEAILIAVQALDAKDAEIAARDKEQAEKRARDAERKRQERAGEKLSRKRPRTVRGRSKDYPLDPPIEELHTPGPDISPDGESQVSARTDDCGTVVSVWNAMAQSAGLATCQKLSPSRRRACLSRIRDDGLDAIQRAIDRVPKSAFLRGDTGNWSGASIDFLLRPDTVTKILEGKYDDRQQPEQRGASPKPALVDIGRQVAAKFEARAAAAAAGGCG